MTLPIRPFHRFAKAAAAAAVILVVCASANAADFHEGLAAYNRGDYDEAVAHWRPLATTGDAESQFRLARMYYHGEAGRDDAQALAWYRKAAEQGHAKAQNNLALLYQEGRGTEPDPAQAASWYRRAADQGLATAQANLAGLYEAGLGVEPSAADAMIWYRKAADQGHAHAQFRLGSLLDEGRGAPGDPARAAKWYRRAAKQDHGPAQAALGAMYAVGRGVERNETKARKWLGSASAKGILAEVPSSAFPAAPEPGTSERPIAMPPSEVAPTPDRLAAPPTPAPDRAPAPPAPTREEAAPDAPAAPAVAAPDTRLAVEPPVAGIVEPGEPPGRSPEPRVLLGFPELREIGRRAERGDREAQYRLAQMYASGEGAPQSLDDAGRWYRAAADQGHALAAYKLAFMNLRGRGVPRKSYVEAYKWFSISADRGGGDAASWRDRIRKKMTDEEIAESERSIAEWNAGGR